MAFEDAYSKPLDVLSDADVDAEKLVDDSLVEIWKPKFGQNFAADNASLVSGTWIMNHDTSGRNMD